MTRAAVTKGGKGCAPGLKATVTKLCGVPTPVLSACAVVNSLLEYVGTSRPPKSVDHAGVGGTLSVGAAGESGLWTLRRRASEPPHPLCFPLLTFCFPNHLVSTWPSAKTEFCMPLVLARVWKGS